MNMLYPEVETLDLKPKEFPTSTAEYVSRGAAVPDDVIKDPKLMREDENSCGVCDEDNDFVPLIDCSSIQRNNYTPNGFKNANQATNNKKIGRYFFYEEPFDEDTGVWIPVSIPPLSLSDHEEFARGFLTNGAYFPEGELTWSQLAGEDKDMTIWDVMLEILLIARGKVTSLSIGELRSCKLPCIPNELLLEHAWNEMSHTIAEASFVNAKEILDAEPPKWVADSAAAACMLCNVKFHPIICSRHHCRFCGGLFCNECSKGRCLLPSKFRIWDPQRVCDVCSVRLHFVQPCLMNQVSRASQLPTLDLIDLSTLRSWLNFPWGQSMECEIYKAANIIHDYNKVGYLKPERSIPDAILKQAKGLAIITVAKVGMMVTYNVGTGLVIARRDDGSWSPPSAISTFGIGWGAQAGGELTDFIIVLKTKDALKNFSRNVHISLGAGISAAAGIIGRTAGADLHAGAGGFAACYTYSRSKGAFLGCSLEGGMLTTRTAENCRFYGSSTINASEILLGEILRPPAAAILYSSLSELFQKLENRLIR